MTTRSSRIATALLENHATVAVRVLRPDGTLLFETQRANDRGPARSPPKSKRTVRRELGDLELLGTLELTVGASGSALVGDSVARATGARRAARLRSQGLDHRRAPAC